MAYTNILYFFIWAFGFFSLLMWPVIHYYGQGSGYKAWDNPNAIGYASNTLGNMGYSSYECQQMPVAIGELTLACKFGVIGSLTDSTGASTVFAGVNPYAAYGDCQPSDTNAACQDVFNANFATEFLSGAVGQQSYTLSWTTEDLFPSGEQASDCTQDYANLYVQFQCVQSDD